MPIKSNRKQKGLTCIKCGESFSAVRSNAKKCQKCHANHSKAWQTSPRGREMRSLKLKEHRNRIIEAYGGGCACCGEERYEFLAIDHVNGGGAKERKRMSSYQVMANVIREGFPDKYRILCHNCNFSRGIYGYCPHEK